MDQFKSIDEIIYSSKINSIPAGIVVNSSTTLNKSY